MTLFVWLLAFISVLALSYFQASKRYAGVVRREGGVLSQARFAGRYVALAAGLAMLLTTFAGLVVSAGPLTLLALICLAGVIASVALTTTIGARFPARKRFELLAASALSGVAAISVLTTFGVFLALIFESAHFFTKVPLLDFLFGTAWSPQTAIRADQVASEGTFGLLPLLSGTLLVTGIAMLVAVPIGLMAAIYMESYAHHVTRDALKLVLELLAGIPTVVYGFFALLLIGPLIASAANAAAQAFGVSIDVPAQNALAAGLVMGVMIIPFVSSLSDDVISAIPPALSEGSYALGATKSETILKVILPAAAPGLIGAFLLAVSRAIGETMIVVMATSRNANLTFNPLERVTTITVQIVSLLTGDQEFDSAKTLAAFALGLVLFLITLCLNIAALLTVKRFRMRYE